ATDRVFRQGGKMLIVGIAATLMLLSVRAEDGAGIGAVEAVAVEVAPVTQAEAEEFPWRREGATTVVVPKLAPEYVNAEGIRSNEEIHRDERGEETLGGRAVV